MAFFMFEIDSSYSPAVKQAMAHKIQVHWVSPMQVHGI